MAKRRVWRVTMAVAVVVLATSAIAFAASFPDGDLAATRLTSDPAVDWYPAFSPDATRVAFVRATPGDHNDVFVINANGTGEHRLTTGENAGSPSWSPDGSRIAYFGHVGGAKLGSIHIYVMRADGTNPVDLTPSAAHSLSPDWSPDGTRIAYTGDDGGIWVLDPDNPVPSKLLPAGSFPRWSHDGTRISFVANGGHALDIADADGGNAHPVVDFSSASILAAASWSADDTRLTLDATDTNSPEQLFGMNADGSGFAPLRISPDNRGMQPDVAPSGKALVYSRNVGHGNFDLYVGRPAPPPKPTPSPSPAPTPCPSVARADARPVGVTVDEAAKYTNRPSVVLRVVAPDSATSVIVADDGGFSQRVAMPLAASETYPWTLVSTGPERLPKTIYVRFSGPCLDPEQTYQDDIILDETPPRLVRARISKAKAPKKGRRRTTVALRATDNASGLSKAQVRYRYRGHMRIVAVRYRRRFVVAGTPRRVKVRVRDGAGNFSRWKTTRR